MATTAEHVNVERARRAYEAFSTGDMQTVGELMADDVIWHVAGDSVISGDYKGKDGVFGFFGKLAQETGGTIKIEVHDILANDEHVAALVTNSAERNGKSLKWNAVNISHSDKEGRVTESWSFVEDSQVVQEFFS